MTLLEHAPGTHGWWKLESFCCTLCLALCCKPANAATVISSPQLTVCVYGSLPASPLPGRLPMRPVVLLPCTGSLAHCLRMQRSCTVSIMRYILLVNRTRLAWCLTTVCANAVGRFPEGLTARSSGTGSSISVSVVASNTRTGSRGAPFCKGLGEYASCCTAMRQWSTAVQQGPRVLQLLA